MGATPFQTAASLRPSLSPPQGLPPPELRGSPPTAPREPPVADAPRAPDTPNRRAGLRGNPLARFSSAPKRSEPLRPGAPSPPRPRAALPAPGRASSRLPGPSSPDPVVAAILRRCRCQPGLPAAHVTSTREVILRRRRRRRAAGRGSPHEGGRAPGEKNTPSKAMLGKPSVSP